MLSSCSSVLYYPSFREHLSPAEFGVKPEDVWIGDLHAWRFRSKRKSSDGLVVFFHGNAENLTSHFSSLSWLPSEGWDYLIFDYRGYGRSPGRPSPRATVEDGRRVLDWALNERVPLVLLGQSLGGAVLLRSLQETVTAHSAEDLRRIRLVTLDSTFSSYQDAGRGVLARSWVTWPFQWLADLLLSDRDAPTKELPKGFSWLVIHGSADQTIDARLGRELYDSLPEPKRWVLTAGGGHIQAFWIHDPRGNYPYREAFSAALRRSIGKTPAAEPELTFELPFEPGGGFEVIQGPGGEFSHQQEQSQAIDFAMPEGTPVRAMRGGRVIQVVSDHGRGGPSSDLAEKANRILIEHRDGTIAEYFHLAQNSAVVSEGSQVKTGELLALSGMSGFASEPHLHVRVYTALGSMPIVFRFGNEPGRILVRGERY